MFNKKTNNFRNFTVKLNNCMLKYRNLLCNVKFKENSLLASDDIFKLLLFKNVIYLAANFLGY